MKVRTLLDHAHELEVRVHDLSNLLAPLLCAQPPHVSREVSVQQYDDLHTPAVPHALECRDPSATVPHASVNYCQDSVTSLAKCVKLLEAPATLGVTLGPMLPTTQDSEPPMGGLSDREGRYLCPSLDDLLDINFQVTFDSTPDVLMEFIDVDVDSSAAENGVLPSCTPASFFPSYDEQGDSTDLLISCASMSSMLARATPWPAHSYNISSLGRNVASRFSWCFP